MLHREPPVGGVLKFFFFLSTNRLAGLDSASFKAL